MNVFTLPRAITGLVIASALMVSSSAFAARVLSSDLGTFSVAIPDVEVFAVPVPGGWQTDFNIAFDAGTSQGPELLSFIIAFEGPVTSLTFAPSSLPFVPGGLAGCDPAAGCYSFELDPSVPPATLSTGSVNASITFAGASSTRYAISAFILDTAGDTLLRDFTAPDVFAAADNTGIISAIPEPGQWALLMVGIGAISLTARSHRLRKGAA